MVKRILMISPAYPSEKNKQIFAFVHARAKIYSAAGLRVKVFIPSSHIYHKYVYEGIEVFQATYDLFPMLDHDFDPDILAVHSPLPRMLMKLTKLNRPIAVWIHGAEVLLRTFHHYFSPFGIKNNIRKAASLLIDARRNLLLRRSVQNVDAVVYVSNWMRKMAEKYLLVKHPHSFVIPNPVDTKLFRPFSSILDRNRNGISVRALEWKYGIDIAVRAFEKLPIKLTVIGKGSLEAYLKNLAYAINSNVEFNTDGVEHNKLPLIYDSFSFFVAPSRTEAQGVAMCEAMASGLPIIATEVGGIPEFVINNYNGLLVPVNDHVSLRRAVLKIVHDDSLRNNLSENARKLALNKLSHDVIFEREMRVFKLAIENDMERKLK